jgi:hypothetical protein
MCCYRDQNFCKTAHASVPGINDVAMNSKRLDTVSMDTCTRVVQKVRGQLRFYQFIYPVYQNVRCKIQNQNKVHINHFKIFT